MEVVNGSQYLQHDELADVFMNSFFLQKKVEKLAPF